MADKNSKSDQLRAMREANADKRSRGGVDGHAPKGSTPVAASGPPERRPRDMKAAGWQREAETGRSPKMARVREQASNCVGQDSDRIAGPTAARGGAGIKPGTREAKQMSKKSPSKVVGKVDIKPKRGPGRPKIKERRPWETEGISRRTWYRRQTGKAGK